MELIVKRKNVYGNELIYPICNKAKLFAQISGNKTLLEVDINLIKKLGYSLKDEDIKSEDYVAMVYKNGKINMEEE